MILRNEPDRVIYGTGVSGAHHLIPEVMLMGWSIFRRAQHDHLALHRHSGAYEFHLIVDGEVEWVVGDEPHLLRAGDVFMTQPGEAHGGRDGVMHPCTIIWFLVEPSVGGNRTDANRAAIDDLLKQLRMRDGRRLRATDAIGAGIRRLLREHAAPDANSRQSARATLQALLIDIIRGIDAAGMATGEAPDAVVRAMDYFRGSFTDQTSLAGACLAAGVNRTTLNRLFLKRVGLSVVAWRNRERARHAARLLRHTSGSVTSIAFDLGFASSQHLATAFRQVYGSSPTDYRMGKKAARSARRCGTPIEWSPEIERIRR